MNKNKKHLAVLSSAAMGLLIASAITTSAHAAVTSYVVADGGNNIRFDLNGLTSDYTNKLLGKASPMFDEFVKHTTITAFEDNKTGFVSYKSVENAYTKMILEGNANKFNLNTVTEAAKAEDIVKVNVNKEWKDGGIKDTQVTPPIQTNLKVESVSAINATQVKVVFTKEVDKNDAETGSKYLIGANPAASASLGSDKKTVTLTFSSQAHVEVTDAVLVVNPIKSEADATISSPRYTQIFTSKDTVKPEIVSVESKTNSNLATSVTIKASEPISSASVKIDGSYVPVNFNNSDTAIITGLNLDAAKSHTIDILNLTDKAGTANVAILTSKTFNVTVDTVAPTVSLTTKSDKQIYLTFNKSMDVASITTALAANTAVKDESFVTVNHAVAAVVPNTDNKEFTIDLNATLYTNKNSRLLTVILPNTIKDSLGNAIATSTQQITLNKDTVAPVATSYKVIKDSQDKVSSLEVNFSEGLAASTPVVPVIVDSNGVAVSSSLLGTITPSAITAGDKKVTYTFGTPAKIAGVYNFSFAANLVTDRAEIANSSAAFNYNIDFGTASGTIDMTTAPTISTNIITVTFPKAVKGGAVANSATDLNNYSLAGKPLPDGTTIVLDGAQKIATITLPAVDSIAKTDTNAIFTVANIKAISGETVNSYSNTLSVVDNTRPVMTSASINKDGTTSIGFSEDVVTSAGKEAAFKVALNGTDLNNANFTLADGLGSDAGKYVLSVKTREVGIAAASGVVTGTNGLTYTGSANNVMKFTFVDMDNSGTLTPGDIVVSTHDMGNTTAIPDAFSTVKYDLNNASALTITTVAGSTVADTATPANALKGATTIKVK